MHLNNIKYRTAVKRDIPEMKYIRDNVTENILISMQINHNDYEDAIFGNGICWVCTNDQEKVIGFACGRIAEKDVWALFINQNYEGHGIGNHLMELLESSMFENNCKIITLSTEAGTRAERLYRRRGWIEIGRKNGEIIFQLLPPSSASA